MGLVVALRWLKDAFGFALEVIWIGALPSLFVGLYSSMVVYLMFLTAALGWGLLVWSVPIVMLTPVVLVWFRIMQQRYRDYLEILLGTTKVCWDIEAAVNGWFEITRLDKKRQRRWLAASKRIFHQK